MIKILSNKEYGNKILDLKIPKFVALPAFSSLLFYLSANLPTPVFFSSCSSWTRRAAAPGPASPCAPYRPPAAAAWAAAWRHRTAARPARRTPPARTAAFSAASAPPAATSRGAAPRVRTPPPVSWWVLQAMGRIRGQVDGERYERAVCADPLCVFVWERVCVWLHHVFDICASFFCQVGSMRYR